jgi:cytochrome c5
MSERIVLVSGTLVIGLLLAATAGAGAEQPTPRAEAAKLRNPVPANAASITAGEQLFRKYCRVCHGATGRGDSPAAPKDMTPSNLTDATWDRGSSDGEIFVVIQEGAGPDFKMKGLKGKIADQDSWHLVNFVRSLSSVKK